MTSKLVIVLGLLLLLQLCSSQNCTNNTQKWETDKLNGKWYLYKLRIPPPLSTFISSNSTCGIYKLVATDDSNLQLQNLITNKKVDIPRINSTLNFSANILAPISEPNSGHLVLRGCNQTEDIAMVFVRNRTNINETYLNELVPQLRNESSINQLNCDLVEFSTNRVVTNITNIDGVWYELGHFNVTNGKDCGRYIISSRSNTIRYTHKGIKNEVWNFTQKISDNNVTSYTITKDNNSTSEIIISRIDSREETFFVGDYNSEYIVKSGVILSREVKGLSPHPMFKQTIQNCIFSCPPSNQINLTKLTGVQWYDLKVEANGFNTCGRQNISVNGNTLNITRNNTFEILTLDQFHNSSLNASAGVIEIIVLENDYGIEGKCNSKGDLENITILRKEITGTTTKKIKDTLSKFVYPEHKFLDFDQNDCHYKNSAQLPSLALSILAVHIIFILVT